MPTNADYTREYFQIVDELDGAVEDRRAAYDYMQASTAIVHHKVRSTASSSTSMSAWWSLSCCRATTTRCCPSPGWTRS